MKHLPSRRRRVLRPGADAIGASPHRARRAEPDLPEPAASPVLLCRLRLESGCPHCSAWRVFHKIDRTLRCHHGFSGSACRAPAPAATWTSPPSAGRHRKAWRNRSRSCCPPRVCASTPTTRAKGRCGHSHRPCMPAGGRAGRHADDRQGARLRCGSRWWSTPTRRCSPTTFRGGRLFALLMQAAGRAGRDATTEPRPADVDPSGASCATTLARRCVHDFDRLRAQPAGRAAAPPGCRPAALRRAGRAPRRGGRPRCATDLPRRSAATRQAALAQPLWRAPGTAQVPPRDRAMIAGLQRRAAADAARSRFASRSTAATAVPAGSRCAMQRR